MREILFRGKTSVNCDWVYGYPVPFDNVTGWVIISHKLTLIPEYASVGTGYFTEVLNDTICQCTGLKDKNGNKIFEGDILQFGTKRLLVYWNDEAFQWQAKTRLGHYTKQYDACPLSMGCNRDWDCITLAEIAAEEIVLGKMSTEIIGNAFDNPDLLKDDKPKQDIGWEEI